MSSTSWSQLFRKKSVANVLAELSAKEESDVHLNRHLGVRDLTALGIAAIVGAGIFSTIGQASYDGGPAVIFLFILVELLVASLLLLMQNSLRWRLFREALIPILTLLLGKLLLG